MLIWRPLASVTSPPLQQRQAQHLGRGRIEVAHALRAIENHHAAGQDFEQIAQACRESLGLDGLLHAFHARLPELRVQLEHGALEIAIRNLELGRHAVERAERLLESLPVLCHGAVCSARCRAM
jgi:hypothetical protein